MVFPFRKKSEDGGERKVKISRTGNPAARPWLVRIYGMVGCLAMTLAFIGIIVWLEKKLPDGSKSQFHPTWRRDAHFDTLETRANVSSVSGVLVETSIFLPVTSTSTSQTPTPAPTPVSLTSSLITSPPNTNTCLVPTLFCPPSSSCYSTDVRGPCSSTTPTRSSSSSVVRITAPPSSTSTPDSCTTKWCTLTWSSAIEEYVTVCDFTTSPRGEYDPTTICGITSTSTSTSSSSPTPTPTGSCITKYCGYFDSPSMNSAVYGCSVTDIPTVAEYDMTTICGITSTSSSSRTPTTTSTSTPGSCVTRYCTWDYVRAIENYVYDCNNTAVPTDSEYNVTTICGITSTSSSSRVPTPTPTCMGSTVICETYAQIGKRQGATQVYETTCATSFFPSTGCGITSTSSTPRPTPTCLGSTVICETYAQIGKRQGATQVYETTCATSFFPSTNCGRTSTSSTRTPTPTCLGSTVICNTFAQIGKRQGATQVYETACATSFFPSTGCGITSTSSSTSSTRTPTPTGCVGSTVICNTFAQIGKRQGATQVYETACATSYFPSTGCGITSTSSVSSSRTTSSSSTPIITSTSRSSTSIPPPSNSCISTGVSCNTFYPPVSVGAAIAEIGGFATTTGAPEPVINCTTTYSSLAICGVTITSNSSSSVPVTSTSSSRSSSSSVFLSSSSSSSSSLLSSSSSSSTVRSPTVTSSSSTSNLLSSTSSLSSSSFSPSRSVSVTPSSISVSSPSVSSSGSSSTIPTVVVVITPSKSSVTVSISSPSPSAPVVTPSTSVPIPSPSSPSSVVSPPSSVSSGTPSLPPVLVVSPSTPTPSSIPLPPSVSSISPSPPVSVTPSLSPSVPSLSPPSVTPVSPVLVVLPSINPSISVESATKPLVAVIIPGSSIPSDALTIPSITPASVSAPTSSVDWFFSPPAVSSTKSGLGTPVPKISSTPLRSVPASVPTTHLASTPSRSVVISSSSIPSVESEISSSNSATGTRASASASASGTGAGGGGGGGGGSNATDVSINSDASIYPISKVITGNYVPIIVARGFVALLTPFYNSILLHEPVRLLTNPGGASIAALSGNPAMEMPIHFAMFVANVGSGFAAGATFLDTSYCNTLPCPPKLSANPWVMDVIVCTLVVQAVAILVIIAQWWRKPSSLSADPTSIAGVAVVMGHPKIEYDFQSIPSDITSAELKKRLRGERYKLGTFMTAAGQVKYGIMPVPDAERKKPRQDRGPGFLTRLKDRIPFIDNWRNNKLYFDCIFLMFLLALLGLTCAALSRVDKPQVVFLATAAASGTGMRIFLAILGILVSFYWGRLFADMQTFTPYTALGRGDADPDPTILLRKHTFPITAFLPLLFKSHYVAASVAFTGLAAEFLILALAGMPYRPGQVRGEFLFWSSIALFILTLMAIQLVVVVLWRRRLPVLARAPDTIASVMTYVAGTGMARDFEDLSMCRTKERDRVVKNMGKSYVYGWRREDGTGRVRWVVDEVGVKDLTPVPSSRRANSF